VSGLPPPPPPPPSPPPPGGAHGYGEPLGGRTPHGARASFGHRLVAALIDGLLIGVPLSILQAIVDPDRDRFGLWIGIGGDPGSSPAFSLLNIVVGVLYYGLLEGGPTGATIGKRVMGIRVVDASTGSEIGVGRGVGRYFARWLSALPCLLGYFWMLWDDQKQTWHDKIVRCYVVRT
jgi:uncharacterized RDD family membrane protein YckC